MFYSPERWEEICDEVSSRGIVRLGDGRMIEDGEIWSQLAEEAIGHDLILFSGDDGPQDIFVAQYTIIDPFEGEY